MLKLFSVVLVLIVMAGTMMGQERRRPSRRQPEKAVATTPVSNTPAAKPSPSPSPSPPAMVPVALVNPTQPEYLSGEANVTVKGNQNPTIRLGLAQNGVNLIEFPAADSFFMVHPGNSELVSFDEETAKLSKRTLVFRPGAAFVAAGSISKGPSVSISVQMQSGMVVTFLIYPVRELSQNAHRCVVMYNRDEVVAARKAAGLAVNLDGRDPAPKANGSIRLDSAEEESSGPIVPKVSRLIADVDSRRADERVRNGKGSSKRPNLSEVANNALREIIRNPSRMGAFSKSSYGLGLAVAPVVDLDVQARMVVIAVRNDSQGVLRIMSGNPELYVQTFDDNGKTLQLEQVQRLYMESTSLEGRLSKGEIAYYAIVYQAPVLGAMQRLRVSVSQMEAADQPATAAVGTTMRR
ncbi:MAG: hypothetical protein LC794_17630 [Acidobacteria bacterium]|nr:hypothetical protein [Acidobacteriota bacterium]